MDTKRTGTVLQDLALRGTAPRKCVNTNKCTIVPATCSLPQATHMMPMLGKPESYLLEFGFLFLFKEIFLIGTHTRTHKRHHAAGTIHDVSPR